MINTQIGFNSMFDRNILMSNEDYVDDDIAQICHVPANKLNIVLVIFVELEYIP